MISARLHGPCTSITSTVPMMVPVPFLAIPILPRTLVEVVRSSYVLAPSTSILAHGSATTRRRSISAAGDIGRHSTTAKLRADGDSALEFAESSVSRAVAVIAEHQSTSRPVRPIRGGTR